MADAQPVFKAIAAACQPLFDSDQVVLSLGRLRAVRDVDPVAGTITVEAGVVLADVQAAGMMLQGMTAQYLLRRTYRVQPGDAITYTISYQNTGDQHPAGVVLTEVVPAHTTYTGSGWTCTPGANAGSTCTLAVGALVA